LAAGLVVPGALAERRFAAGSETTGFESGKILALRKSTAGWRISAALSAREGFFNESPVIKSHAAKRRSDAFSAQIGDEFQGFRRHNFAVYIRL
jgi:hypothetical protein